MSSAAPGVIGVLTQAGSAPKWVTRTLSSARVAVRYSRRLAWTKLGIWLDGRAGRLDLHLAGGEDAPADRQHAADQRPSPAQVVVVAVRVQDLQDPVLLVVPVPRRHEHDLVRVPVLQLEQGRGLLLPQRRLEQAEQRPVRGVGGGQADLELLLHGGQARVRVVDQHRAELDLAPLGRDPELAAPVEQRLDRRQQDRRARRHRRVTRVA